MRLIYVFAFALTTIGLSGCETTPDPDARSKFYEYNGNMPYWSNNQGRGVLNAGVDVTRDQMIERMSFRCRQMNRWLNVASIQLEECYTGGNVCRHRYFCSDSPPPSPVAPAIKTTPTEDASSIRKVDPQGSFEEMNARLKFAREKCVDLGFKADTEKFGDCVLRLSK